VKGDENENVVGAVDDECVPNANDDDPEEIGGTSPNEPNEREDVDTDDTGNIGVVIEYDEVNVKADVGVSLVMD
jgi:hypothetical protein